MLLYAWQFAESRSVALVNFQKIWVSQPFDSPTQRQGLPSSQDFDELSRAAQADGTGSTLSRAEWVETGLESY